MKMVVAAIDTLARCHGLNRVIGANSPAHMSTGATINIAKGHSRTSDELYSQPMTHADGSIALIT